jgi:hypothetical protein
MYNDDEHENVEVFDGVKAIAETDKALLCIIDGDEHWVPKSQIVDDSEVYAKGHEGELQVRKWWADKAGLT